MSLGLCQPRIPGTVGAEPFSAKIRYTGPDDPDYPNLIKLTVTMPHMDGECHHLHSHVDLIHLQYRKFQIFKIESQIFQQMLYLGICICMTWSKASG